MSERSFFTLDESGAYIPTRYARSAWSVSGADHVTPPAGHGFPIAVTRKIGGTAIRATRTAPAPMALKILVMSYFSFRENAPERHRATPGRRQGASSSSTDTAVAVELTSKGGTPTIESIAGR